MALYYHHYKETLKRNYMLLVMAFVLLTVTFFLWAGVPFFLVGSFVANFTKNVAIVYFVIALSGGFLFSLYFVPLNMKVAKHIAVINGNRIMMSFFKIQLLLVIISSLIFGIVLLLL